MSQAKVIVKPSSFSSLRSTVQYQSMNVLVQINILAFWFLICRYNDNHMLVWKWTYNFPKDRILPISELFL